MMMGSRQKLRSSPEISSSINGDRVDTVQEFKYLGIILDDHVIFDRHIDYIVDKSTT